MSDRELSEYDSILRETDTHLYAWLVKREDVPEDISELATYQVWCQKSISHNQSVFGLQSGRRGVRELRKQQPSMGHLWQSAIQTICFAFYATFGARHLESVSVVCVICPYG